MEKIFVRAYNMREVGKNKAGELTAKIDGQAIIRGEKVEIQVEFLIDKFETPVFIDEVRQLK